MLFYKELLSIALNQFGLKMIVTRAQTFYPFQIYGDHIWWYLLYCYSEMQHDGELKYYKDMAQFVK